MVRVILTYNGLISAERQRCATQLPVWRAGIIERFRVVWLRNLLPLASPERDLRCPCFRQNLHPKTNRNSQIIVIGIAFFCGPGHHDSMLILRKMICFVLIIMMLPWAAHAAAFAASARSGPAAAISEPNDLAAGQDRAAPQTTSQTKVFAPRKCRTAILPGFSCSPDPAIELIPCPQWQEPLKAVFFLSGQWAGRARADPPPRIPPRSF